MSVVSACSVQYKFNAASINYDEIKTIQIADKGLNCARNIHEAIENGDGYLFSKSLKQMKDIDADWFFSLDSSTWDAVYEKDEHGRETVKYRYYSYTEVFDYEYDDDNGNRPNFLYSPPPNQQANTL